MSKYQKGDLRRLTELMDIPSDHKPPAGHDKELADHERAHSGQPGSKVKHGADANNQMVRRPSYLDTTKKWDSY